MVTGDTRCPRSELRGSAAGERRVGWRSSEPASARSSASTARYGGCARGDGAARAEPDAHPNHSSVRDGEVRAGSVVRPLVPDTTRGWLPCTAEWHVDRTVGFQR